MKTKALNLTLVLVLGILGTSYLLKAAGAGGWTLVGWNNLGMHCMDSDYSVFSILPPFNTIQAHLLDSSGHLVTNPTGVTVTYEALADPTGSINVTSRDKTLFWLHMMDLFGVSLDVDLGLAGMKMPGTLNQPQPMKFDSTVRTFIAEGIPITPYDDDGQKNPYPMMRLVARDAANTILASTDIVVPVSDEMDCRACHASDSPSDARPSAGWAHDDDPERDFRLNILRLHDQINGGSASYSSALAQASYNPSGLYPTVVNGNKTILCASCHTSNALPGTGYSTILPLTQAMHSFHAQVLDPTSGQTLDNTSNRSACYQCHPGALTRCLRGTMGNAVASDGTMAIQCQNCHGSMSAVGWNARQGWLDEPDCQNCHTGTAVKNSGQIRFTSAFSALGFLRTPADATFATQANTPASGISLYRFSSGHGGLQCSACHHSTHAEYPSSHLNDNIQALQLQNHVGTISECSTCHNTQPSTTNGGPHGMHPIGQNWARNHESAVEKGGSTGCQACHGQDYRGTVLSRALGDRNISTEYGTKQLWRGRQIGCYSCHNGPSAERANSTQAPVVTGDAAVVQGNIATIIPLQASSPSGNSIQLRVVSQPAHGTVALSGANATYYPSSGYGGPDSFTFAASDGSLDSNLGTVTLSVMQTFVVPFLQAGPATYTGIAVTNYSSSAAHIEFTAFGIDGNPLILPVNPSSFVLQPKTQLARLSSEIFGVNSGAAPPGWIRMTADTGSLGCLFQYGGAAQLDGSIAQTQTSKHLRFTRILEGPNALRGLTATTLLSIVNPTGDSITLSLKLYGSQPGQLLAPAVTRTLPARGLLYSSVSDLFGSNLSVSKAYLDVQVTAGGGALGFELIKILQPQTVLGLDAAPEDGPYLSYSAQLASNISFFTNLKLINVDSSSRVVTLRAVSESGTNLAPARSIRLDPGQSLEQDVVEALALASGTSAIGSIIVNADGPGILGDVIFGDPAALDFAAILRLQSKSFRQAVLNHVANSEDYFTGLVLLNPGRQTATVTLQIYSENGSKTGAPLVFKLDAGARMSQVLTQLVPASAGQMRGFVMLSSTQPLIAQQLFGDSQMTLLSSVPPTIIH